MEGQGVHKNIIFLLRISPHSLLIHNYDAQVYATLAACLLLVSQASCLNSRQGALIRDRAFICFWETTKCSKQNLNIY